MNGTAQTEKRVRKRSRDSKNPGLYGVAIRVRSQKRPGVFQLFLSDMVEDVTVRQTLVYQTVPRSRQELAPVSSLVPRGELDLPKGPGVKSEPRPGGVMS